MRFIRRIISEVIQLVKNDVAFLIELDCFQMNLIPRGVRDCVRVRKQLLSQDIVPKEETGQLTDR